MTTSGASPPAWPTSTRSPAASPAARPRSSAAAVAWARARAGAREAEVRKMSNALKLLFKRLDVAGVVLAQLNRAGGTDRPSLHHLRESGAIEQDGDLIIRLYREDYYRHHEEHFIPSRILDA